MDINGAKVWLSERVSEVLLRLFGHRLEQSERNFVVLECGVQPK